jgi:ATP-binding cassette, subfamily B, multidrug efflux pump
MSSVPSALREHPLSNTLRPDTANGAPTPFQRMASYWRRYPAAMIFGGLTVLIAAYISLYAPRVIRMAVDDLRVSVTQEKILQYSLFVIAVSAGRGVFLYLQRKILVALSRDIEYDLRNDFYRHLHAMPPAFFQRQRIGDLMSRATNDISAVRMLVGPAMMYGLNTLFTVILVGPAMIAISGQLTLFALMTLPLAAFATQYFGSRIHERSEAIQEYFGLITAKAQENFSGVRVVRAYAQEDAEEKTFRAMNREFVARNLRLIKLSALFRPALDILFGFGPAVVLWYGGHLVLDGRMTLGQFVEFNLYLGILVWPMIALGWVVNLFQRGMASMRRLNDIFNESPAIDDAQVRPDIGEIKGEIEFRNLTFSYPTTKGGERPAALRNINLKIRKGSTVAVVGATGAGKSTLINLIPRLLDAASGQVFIDGRPIRDYPLQQLRAAVGYVQQESFLFGDTIANNIAFGAESAAREDIVCAAEQSALRADVEAFPNQFDTLIGERGVTLSGGQKQRTALARAIIRNPKILILDDSLSAVDTYTEETILGHLRKIMRGRTTILVSHRISTVKDADHIVFLHDGEIVEEGTHDQLLARKGRYAELHEKQLLEAELAAM